MAIFQLPLKVHVKIFAIASHVVFPWRDKQLVVLIFNNNSGSDGYFFKSTRVVNRLRTPAAYCMFEMRFRKCKSVFRIFECIKFHRENL